MIAFSKGNRGWAAFNNGAEGEAITVQTGLPAGTYCDLIHGKRQGSSCTGPTVTVTSSGSVTVTVGSYDAVAIDRANRI